MLRLAVILLASALLPHGIGAAQSAPELFGRSAFTEGSGIVPTGSVQVEMVSTWEEAGEAQVNGSEALSRWGVHDRLELRFGMPDYIRSSDASGWSDAYVGAKLAVGRSSGWDFSLVGEGTVPVGNSRYGPDGTEASLVVAADRPLGERLVFGTEVTGTWAPELADVSLAYATALTLGISESISTFAALAFDPLEEGARPWLLHYGVALAATSTLQLDLHGGLGLSELGPDTLVGLGLNTRVGGD